MQKVNSGKVNTAGQSQCKKSTLVNGKVNAWSTQKVNSGQRKSQRKKTQLWSTEKSTVNASQSQWSTLGLTWHCADVAVACLGLTWIRADVASWRRDTWQRRGLARGVRAREWLGHRIFRRRVRARPVSNAAVFCFVESRILRYFQRYRRCLDRSPGMVDPRAAVGPFRR